MFPSSGRDNGFSKTPSIYYRNPGDCFAKSCKQLQHDFWNRDVLSFFEEIALKLENYENVSIFCIKTNSSEFKQFFHKDFLN